MGISRKTKFNLSNLGNLITVTSAAQRLGVSTAVLEKAIASGACDITTYEKRSNKLYVDKQAIKDMGFLGTGLQGEVTVYPLTDILKKYKLSQEIYDIFVKYEVLEAPYATVLYPNRLFVTDIQEDALKEVLMNDEYITDKECAEYLDITIEMLDDLVDAYILPVSFTAPNLKPLFSVKILELLKEILIAEIEKRNTKAVRKPRLKSKIEKVISKEVVVDKDNDSKENKEDKVSNQFIEKEKELNKRELDLQKREEMLSQHEKDFREKEQDLIMQEQAFKNKVKEFEENLKKKS